MDQATTKMTLSVNPATGETFAETPEHSVADVHEAVAAAKQAQKAWAALGFNGRKPYLLRIRDYIAGHADRIAETISRDTGKTRVDAMSTEVLASAMAITYYATHAERILRPHSPFPGNILLVNKRTVIERLPFGVIGIISPWNYPFSIPFHEIAMALISGNTVVLKVATQTLAVGKMIEECVAAAKLPPGVFTHLNIPGKLAGDAFLSGGINKLFFTGSVPVGKELMRKAAEKLIPVSLELGGNDAMVVCEDADIERAVGGALWAGLSNAGQSCAGVERIYVSEKIYRPFTASLKRRLASLRVGIDSDFNVDIGSLTTEGQLAVVRNHVADAVEKGATVFAGNNKEGGNNVGLFHPPVILENVTNDMLTMREETFGPVLAIDSFSTIDEVVAKVNDSRLGLTASVWSQDRKKARAIARRLEAGAITINDHLMSHGLAESPWGGFKESGIGRTHGALGLEEMTQPHAIIDDFLAPLMKKNFWWHPHSKATYRGLNGALQFLYGKHIGKRVDGLMHLLPEFIRCFMKSKQ